MKKKRNKKGFWNWVKVNKEGAIIGGVIGLISTILVFVSAFTMGGIQIPLLSQIATIFPVLMSSLGQLIGNVGIEKFPWVFLTTPVYVLIGAFIDSKWRPDK